MVRFNVLLSSSSKIDPVVEDAIIFIIVSGHTSVDAPWIAGSVYSKTKISTLTSCIKVPWCMHFELYIYFACWVVTLFGFLSVCNSTILFLEHSSWFYWTLVRLGRWEHPEHIWTGLNISRNSHDFTYLAQCKYLGLNSYMCGPQFLSPSGWLVAGTQLTCSRSASQF